MPKRTRDRQLARLASRRAAERRARRRRRAVTIGVALVVAALGLSAVGATFLFGGDDRPVASASPTQTPTAGAVACDGEVPAAASEEKPMYEAKPEMMIDRDARYRAVLTTSCGKVGIDLFADRAPETVNSFVFLARDGYYDGLTFHRVIDGFMIQGGDPKGDGTGGPGYSFGDELDDELVFDRKGLLAMANAGPNTNGSQFFITLGPAEHLNGRHTIFGRVVEGMDVVQEIGRVQTGAQDRPVETVYIEKVKITES